jgi:hypothetical protein
MCRKETTDEPRANDTSGSCFTRFEKLGESVPELAQSCYMTGGLYDKDEV